MADAEYMMNNYSAAQNQGCWDDDGIDWDKQIALYELTAADPNLPIFQRIDHDLECKDTSCKNYNDNPILF